ncbi:MAG: LapA family protein [Gemmatimonadetes bacterium]|nr:MAG: LapA family protein [Gemmatimonadota bacterium]
MLWRLLLLIILLVVFVLTAFIVLNIGEQVTINFFWTKLTLPVGLALASAFFLGVAIMYFWNAYADIKLQRKVKKLEKSNQELRAELYELTKSRPNATLPPETAEDHA